MRVSARRMSSPSRTTFWSAMVDVLPGLAGPG
jgi:hypothetical protein